MLAQPVYLNFLAINRIQLESEESLAKHIEFAPTCIYNHHQDFFIYRRNHDQSFHIMIMNKGRFMKVKDLSLHGLKLIIPDIYPDERGFFYESYRESFYKQNGITTHFIQDNHSYSKKNVIRGLHFDPQQAKLVRVGYGKTFNVMVDIRRNSKTCGKWEGVYLDSNSHYQLYIPVGFAYGFAVMSDDAHVLYKVSSEYNPTTERGFRYDDESIGIEWPVEHPIISERDQKCPKFSELKNL